MVINELLASNSHNMPDPQGQYDDWIELHNRGDAPVDVGGMYLTDDLDEPTQWQFPTDNPTLTTIAPQGYLLVWADNDVGDPGLHAGFKLSASGDDVALFDRDGVTLIDSIRFDRQTTDVSYGRLPDTVDTWAPLAFPTPMSPNIRIFQGFVEEPEISPEHGFYQDEILVTLTCRTAGAMIYYSLDGTDPYLPDRMRPGATAGLYSTPLRINKTTCVRAVASIPGWKASPVKTSTYIFLRDVVVQSPQGQRPDSTWPSGSVNGQTIDYGMDPDVINDPRYKDLIEDALLAIPSFSLVTDPANLFDSQTGIYVNAERYGRDWERPASVELIHPDGTEGFQINAGLRIRGGYSRIDANPKHAFRLFFRTEYGAPRLEYPLFGPEGVDEFENMDLRTSQNYSWAYDGDSRNTFLRDIFSRDTQRDMGQPYTRSGYCHLYLNGQYWGLFQTQERPEASYAESYFGGNKDDYDVVKAAGRNAGYTIEATDGTLDNYRLLWEAATQGFDNDERYYQIQGINPDGTANPEFAKLVDVDNLIDYMLCTFYVGDFDGPISNFLGNNRANNFYAILNREGPEGFKWFRHDAEHTLIDAYGWGLDRTGPYTHPDLARFNYFTPQWLHQQLIGHPEYRMRFADRTHKHLFNEGLLTYNRSKERMSARAEQIETAIIAESVRWGDSKRSTPYTKEHWQREVDRIINDYGDFGLPNRTQVVLSQLKADGWYLSISAPGFNQHGGYVADGFTLRMDAPGDIYYTLDGTDPRKPEKARQTTAEHVLVSESATKRVLVPTGDVPDAWKGGDNFDDSAWRLVSGAPGGIGYERSTGYEPFISLNVQSQMYGRVAGCYLRIPFNLTADPAQISSLVLKVRYDDGFVAYLNGVEVQRALFVGEPKWDSQADGSHEGDSVESFPISGHANLLRQGQNILAIHALNQSVSSSDFIISVGLEGGESAGEQGGGITETAMLYTGPVTLNKSTLVKARVRSGNSWSALNEAVFAIGPVAESLKISEIMYHPAETGNPDDPNTEFIELTNTGSQAINLNLVRFTNGVDYTFPSFELPVGGYCLIVRDIAAFEAKYGADLPVVGQYTGSLNNAGERVELADAMGTVIHSFRFRDGWYDHLCDGPGFSLTVKEPSTAGLDGLDNKSPWRPSALAGGSPGTDDSGQVPELGSVVINELLANSAGNTPDWIELYNTTGHAIDLGGWFLSDDCNDLTKYQIAAGTSIAAGGYMVFYEDKHFGNQADPGCARAFGLSRSGETVYLHSGSAGELTGYTDQEKFDASDPGVTLGRWRKSTGAYNFVALQQPTPEAANAEPVVGPIVINEIMYHPSDAGDAEYVELLNISNTPVTLYDAIRRAPWRFTDDPDNPGTELLFPTDPPVTLAPGEYLVLAKDLTVFHAGYTVAADVQVLAWGTGSLSNGGEKIQLSKPGDDNANGNRAWIRVDRAVYSDGSHPEDFPEGLDPWPAEADGQGGSLSRIDPQAYGNDPENWKAGDASPGSVNP